jgi:hypothetical protein
MEAFIPGGFALIGLVCMFLNVAVINAKTTINKWTKEFLQTGRIKSNEVSEIRTMYSFDYLSNMTLDIGPKNKFRILRSKKIRDKIRDYKKLTRARNYSLLALIIFVGVSLLTIRLTE